VPFNAFGRESLSAFAKDGCFEASSDWDAFVVIKRIGFVGDIMPEMGSCMVWPSLKTTKREAKDVPKPAAHPRLRSVKALLVERQRSQ
jgi:hypothetical protein